MRLLHLHMQLASTQCVHERKEQNEVKKMELDSLSSLLVRTPGCCTSAS